MEFKNLSFSKDKDNLIVTFKSNYYFTIPLEEIEEIGKFSIKENTIEFDCVKKVAEKKFDNLIDKHFNLINKVTKNPTTYVDEEFPLIGTLSFGIVDKGTNILELKPISGCNSDCIFCSVDSGKTSKKAQDFYVDKDHLVNETKKLVEYKDTPTDIYINPQGESLLYPDLEELIQDLRKIKLINYYLE